MGAADYVVKPLSPTELAARIRAALRKRETPEPSAPYVLGDLAIDYAQRRATLAGSPVRLTAIEYRTLAELAANAGRLLTYEHLLQRVWALTPTPTCGPCAPSSAASAASWATTPTTQPTSSPS